MALTDWIISVSAAVIVILIGVVSYFAQKWVDSLEKTIEKHSNHLENLANEVNSLKQEKAAQAKSLSEAIQSQLSAFKFPHSKIDKIEQEVSVINATVKLRLLPIAEQQAANLGRVIVLEESVKEQNLKLLTMFNALKAMVPKYQKPQNQK